MALFIVCLASLILGLPLAVNMMWHLQIATNTSGRGVTRLTRDTNQYRPYQIISQILLLNLSFEKRMGGSLKALISSLYILNQVPPLHKPPKRARNLHGARDPGVAGEQHSNSGVRLSRVDGGLHKPEPLPRGPPDSDLQVGGERTVF